MQTTNTQAEKRESEKSNNTLWLDWPLNEKGQVN